MLTQTTKLAQIEVTDYGLQILLHLVISSAGIEVDRKNHRTTIPYDHPSVQPQMDAVNEHLTEMGRQPLPQDQIDRVQAIFETALPLAPESE